MHRKAHTRWSWPAPRCVCCYWALLVTSCSYCRCSWRLYSAWFSQSDAAWPLSGLSMLGSPSRLCSEMSTVRTSYSADHWSFKGQRKEKKKRRRRRQRRRRRRRRKKERKKKERKKKERKKKERKKEKRKKRKKKISDGLLSDLVSFQCSCLSLSLSLSLFSHRASGSGVGATRCGRASGGAQLQPMDGHEPVTIQEPGVPSTT